MRTRVNFSLPLGAYKEGNAIHFRVASAQAKQLRLGLFLDPKQLLPSYEIAFDPLLHRTGTIWHICVEDIPEGCAYGYRTSDEPKATEKSVWLLDPYSPLISSPHLWCSERLEPFYRPLSLLDDNPPFDWGDDHPLRTPWEKTILYEMHVRGFTKDISSGVKHPGTFLGLIEKIPHLKTLGVTAVELLPIMEWNEAEYYACALKTHTLLSNYWGYSTVHYLSPMGRFAVGPEMKSAINECKQMVKALHEAGIEVILDVVWNHTAEGGKDGPVYSLKGLDLPIYYLTDTAGNMLDYTGCGNTVQTNHPRVIEWIIFTLRYWVTQFHIDGFRFDLASIFHRGRYGRYLDPAPIIEAITHDPLLGNVKLIAESWDAAGLYEVGSFYKAGNAWKEWNGQYRDSVRAFIKGSPASLGIFATRICGSRDLYGAEGSPLNSVNFLTAHDGFTLHDLVSYQSKHNLANGEGNRDGHGHNESWNCGHEGPTHNHAILTLRSRQMRNLHVALLISQGIPMLHMGDEYGHTKGGNNNSWCQDNQVNWFLWDQLHEKKAFFRFYCLMIALRKQHLKIFNGTFLGAKEIIWHGKKPTQPNWQTDSHFISLQLIDETSRHDLLIAFNAGPTKVDWDYAPSPEGRKWHWVVNTSKSYPDDIHELNALPEVQEKHIEMLPYSSCILSAEMR